MQQNHVGTRSQGAAWLSELWKGLFIARRSLSKRPQKLQNFKPLFLMRNYRDTQSKQACQKTAERKYLIEILARFLQAFVPNPTVRIPYDLCLLQCGKHIFLYYPKMKRSKGSYNTVRYGFFYSQTHKTLFPAVQRWQHCIGNRLAAQKGYVVQKYLKRKGFPVAPILYANDCFCIMRHMEGKQLSHVWDDLPRLQQENFIRQVAQFQCRLHKFRFPHAGTLCFDFSQPEQYGVVVMVDDAPTYNALVLRLLDNAFTYYANNLHVCANLAWVKENYEVCFPSIDERYVICHQDLNFHNILVNQTEITCVLDWDESKILPAGLVHRYPDDIRYNMSYQRVYCGEFEELRESGVASFLQCPYQLDIFELLWDPYLFENMDLYLEARLKNIRL